MTLRIGTTSYIIPDDILPNARYLANLPGRPIQDIELVLFEVDDGQNNLPDDAAVAELADLSRQTGLTFTVHLPLDLRLGTNGSEQHESLAKARRVIERTRALRPWAYVLHLDGRAVKDTPAGPAYQRWLEQSLRALELAAGWAGSPELLAVENLEGYPLDFWEPVFEHSPVMRCVDIGHLWRDGHDPLPYLERALPRTRVIHIHGIGERDHQSLALMPQEQLVAADHCLLAGGYAGVLTLKVFGQDDFNASLQALLASQLRWDVLEDA